MMEILIGILYMILFLCIGINIGDAIENRNVSALFGWLCSSVWAILYIIKH